jgi:hypothetical protein
MTEADRSRVVIWLDPAAPQEGWLDVLAGLGSASEILGLFIEDMSLLELSGHPVAREFTVDTAATRSLDFASLERQFRAHALRMQKLFESASRGIRSPCSFRVTRGEPGAELVKISGSCDMLIVAHSRRHLAPRLTVRARLNELLTSGPRTLLFVQERWLTGRCIAVLFEASDAGTAALRAAVALATAEDLSLSVWLPGGNPATRDELIERCEDILDEATRRTYIVLEDHDNDALAHAAAVSQPRAIVLPAGNPTETSRLVTGLLDRVNCSLIVTR